MGVTYPPTYLAMFLAVIGVMLMLVIWEMLKLVEDISPEKGDKIRSSVHYTVVGVWFVTSAVCGFILLTETWLKL